jgi:tetratricopeptide (TPR) repeat protein
MLEEALRIRREHLGDHVATADSIGELALCLAELGEGTRSTALYREALAMRQRILPPDDPRIALAMNDLGAALGEQNLFDEAETMEREALRMLRARPGNDETLSMLLTNLGFLHYQRSELSAAEACFREALEIQRRLLGSDHPLVLTSLNNLANTLNQQGEFPEAEILFREALTIGTRVFGQDHPDVARYHKNLGAVLLEQGRIDEAVASFRLSHAMRLKALGEAHPDVARSAYSLASALVETDPVEAETLARGALAKAKELPESVEGDLNLAIARSLLKLGVRDEAVERARRGVELRTASYPSGHWAVADAESLLGEALIRTGRRAEGASLVRAAYEALRTKLGDGRRVTRLARARLELLDPSPVR